MRKPSLMKTGQDAKEAILLLEDLVTFQQIEANNDIHSNPSLFSLMLSLVLYSHSPSSAIFRKNLFVS